MSFQSNPFKYLHSYEEKDQDDFSGCELDEPNLFNLVTANAHAMVYVKSGIGKTSLLHAGLFHMLRGDYFMDENLIFLFSFSSVAIL